MAQNEELVMVRIAPDHGIKMFRSEAEEYVKANKGATIESLPEQPAPDESPAEEATHVAAEADEPPAGKKR
jgi:hypothetical protein